MNAATAPLLYGESPLEIVLQSVKILKRILTERKEEFSQHRMPKSTESNDTIFSLMRRWPYRLGTEMNNKILAGWVMFVGDPCIVELY